jgi:lipopolysaccharide/colanic/teichoic acid biosynthesis glycosyltransferase
VTGPSRTRVIVHGAVKRSIDFTTAAVALVLLVPAIAVIAVLIKLDSRGPVFYRASRVGRRGRQLRMLKFRKMRDGATGRPLTTDDDDRFTRIGVWLARLKLDEIPQLWHVLRGEMSLIGPRPEHPDFVACFPEEYERILQVCPGITGFSQIAFAEESSILADNDPLGHYVSAILPQKIGMDLMYAERRHLRDDVRTVLWTSAAVLLRRPVAVHRKTGRMNLRRREVRAPIQLHEREELAAVSHTPALVGES